MQAPAKLSLFTLALAVVFGLAYVLGGVLVPETLVETWTQHP